MNIVNEPGPNGDSETPLSRKTRSKPSQVHEHQNWPSWRPGAHWRAQVRARLSVSWVGLAVSWSRPPSVSQPKPPCRRAHARAPARRAAPLRALPRSPTRLACRIVALAAVSWALAARQPGRIAGPVSRAGRPCPRLAVLYCNTAQPFLLRHVTIQFLYCDTSLISLQACLSPNCIAIQLLDHQAYCNTIFPTHCTPNLQYNNCIAIQF